MLAVRLIFFRLAGEFGSFGRRRRRVGGGVGKLDNDFVAFQKVQFPPDKILNHFRIMLEAVNGFRQAHVGLCQPGVFFFQTQTFLLQHIKLVNAPVTEKADHGHNDQGKAHHPKPEVRSPPRLGRFPRRRSLYQCRSPLNFQSLALWLNNHQRCNGKMRPLVPAQTEAGGQEGNRKYCISLQGKNF